VLSIGSLEDDLLFQWVGICVDSDHIYVLDAMDYALKKFDSSGCLVGRTGRRGQGPGEFMAPRLLTCSKDFLYATDQGVPGIQVFSKNLEFLRRVPIPWPIVDFAVLSDNKFAIAALLPGQAGAIFIADEEGKLVRKIRYSEKDNPLMMDLVSFSFDSQGSLFLAYTFQDKIEKFSSKGLKIWSCQLLNVKRVRRKKISRYVLPTQIVYKDIALDSLGNIYVLGGNFSENRSRDIYVLDQDGKHKAVFTLPESSHLIYFDPAGFLYSRGNHGVTLKKFGLRAEDEQSSP
jgi:hypothetical protein